MDKQIELAFETMAVVGYVHYVEMKFGYLVQNNL